MPEVVNLARPVPGSPPAPAPKTIQYEASWDDMECCLLTVRDCLSKMRPTRVITRSIQAIDRTLHGPIGPVVTRRYEPIGSRK